MKPFEIQFDIAELDGWEFGEDQEGGAARKPGDLTEECIVAGIASASPKKNIIKGE